MVFFFGGLLNSVENQIRFLYQHFRISNFLTCDTEVKADFK